MLLPPDLSRNIHSTVHSTGRDHQNGRGPETRESSPSNVVTIISQRQNDRRQQKPAAFSDWNPPPLNWRFSLALTTETVLDYFHSSAGFWSGLYPGCQSQKSRPEKEIRFAALTGSTVIVLSNSEYLIVSRFNKRPRESPTSQGTQI
jgi:hypothetical protein